MLTGGPNIKTVGLDGVFGAHSRGTLVLGSFATFSEELDVCSDAELGMIEGEELAKRLHIGRLSFVKDNRLLRGPKSPSSQRM